MKLKIQYRDSNNKLVKKSSRKRKRVIIFDDSGHKVYKSKIAKRTVSGWQKIVEKHSGKISVERIKGKLRIDKNAFVYGKYYDKDTGFFYSDEKDLKGKYNSVIGYFLITALYEDEDDTKRVVVRHRVYLPEKSKRTVKKLREIILEQGMAAMMEKGYTNVKFQGFSAFNWKRGRTKDIFDRQLFAFLKTKKKRKSKGD